MDLRTKICLWIILIGMVNFIAYTVGYSIVGGESVRGKVLEDPNTGKLEYYLDKGTKVHRDTFIYIGIHSITIWPTVAAIMLSMLTLAKDRIADTMVSAMMRGRSFCTILAVLIAIGTAGMTFHFIRDFADNLRNPKVIEIIPTADSMNKGLDSRR
jgi:hypothetical protein